MLRMAVKQKSVRHWTDYRKKTGETVYILLREKRGRVREFGRGQRSGDRVRSLPGNVGYSQRNASGCGITQGAQNAKRT